MPVKKKKEITKKPSVKAKNHKEVDAHIEVEKRYPDGEKEIIYEKGTKVENEDTPIAILKEGRAMAGLSKGMTINLGNYESARINCWITRTCKDDDKAIMDNLAEISNMLDEQIQFEVEELEETRNN